MDGLKQWAALICAVATGSFFTVFLIPDGKMKKQAETVISLVFLLFVVSLISSGNITELDEFPEFSDEKIVFDNQAYITDNVREYTENFVRAEIKDICNGEFTVDAELSSADGVITLLSITVFIDKKDLYSVPEIKNKVSKVTGIIPEVITE